MGKRSLWDKILNGAETPEEQHKRMVEEYNHHKNTPKPAPVSCPRCHSTQISSDHRGWKFTTGFLGSSQIIITCLNCGHQWKPGRT